jgi:hypothetical protein
MDDDALKRLIEGSAAETRTQMHAQATETRRLFGEVVENLDTKFELVAEGFSTVVARVDRMENTMKEGFAEVKAMITFSHADLDRRLRTLEDVVSTLQSRVERIEGMLPS